MSESPSNPVSSTLTVKTTDGLHRTGWFGLAVILLVYLVLALAFSQTMPFSRALDEGYHLEYITFIKQNGRLPITYEERSQITRADFPPLYQLSVALLSAPVSVDGPPVFKYFWDSFRYQAIDHQTDQVGTLLTEDTQPPYLGRFLVWQIGRWWSIGLSLATLVVVFLTLQELPLTPKPLLPLAGTALLAFLPRYITLGVALNDDNLLGLLAALYFWLLIKGIKKPQTWWPFIGLGILLGLSITVKYTLIIVPIEVALVSLALAKQRHLGWPWLGRRLAAIAGLALLGSSWWFGWNIWFLNTVEQDGWVAGLLSPLLTGGSDTTLNRLGGFFSGGQVGLTDLPENTQSGTFLEWLQATFFSFWGTGYTAADGYIYLAIGLMLGVTAVGLWRLWRTDLASRQWLLLLAFHISLFVILPLVRFGLSRRLGQTAQGRHILIPAAAAVVGLLVWGLAAVIPPRWRCGVFAGLVTGLLLWNGAYLYRMATFASPLLPLRTLPQAAEWLAQPLKANFGDSIELSSYELDPRPEQGRLNLNLAWRSLAQVNQNYLLQITLANSSGQTVSHWLGYPAQGRLPTLAWDPGDTVFDRLALPLPALPGGDYQLTLQLTGDQDGVPLGETVSLPVNLQTSTASALPPGAAYALWQTYNPPPSPLHPSAFIPQPSSSLPPYRYPATITLLSATPVQLLDPSGQPHPPARSEANLHHFIIGPRWPDGAYRLQQGADISSEPLLTVENWWPRQFDPPTGIEVPAQANFANQLNFLGYSLPQKQVKAGEAFPLTLYWQALPNRSPQANFVQFNHLLDSQGQLRGGYDRLPLEYYSTLLWSPGEVVVDGYAVPVEADAPPGQYYLSVGYYLTVGEAAVNLPLVENGQMSQVSSVTIGPIEVVAP